IKKLLLSLFVGILSVAPSASKAQMLPAVNPGAAEFDFVPIETWHYGLADALDGQACVFSNIYNNGYVLQVFEKDELIKSFIIDFGQAAFEENTFYPFILSVNGEPKEVRGLAVTRSAIRFNLSQYLPTSVFEDYSGGSIKTRTEEVDFKFMLNGLGDVLKTINNCVVGPAAPKKDDMEVASAEAAKELDNNETELDAEIETASKEPNPLHPLVPDLPEEEGAKTTETQAEEKTEEKTKLAEKKNDQDAINEEEVHGVVAVPPTDFPEELAEKADGKPVEMKLTEKERKHQEALEKLGMGSEKASKETQDEKEPALKAVSLKAQNEGDEPLPLEKKDVSQKEKPAQNSVYRWVAKKGERLSETLARWADKAGVAIEWNADKDPEVETNIATDAEFEEAVSVLLATVQKDAGAPLYSAVTSEAATSSSPTQLAPEKNPVEEEILQMSEHEWRGLKGMPLKTVLQNWTEKAKVDLVWEAGDNFNLPQEYKQEKPFAEAVMDVLDYFGSMEVSPVAQLNKDPETGKLTLIIRSVQKS
ncbi:MAG: hypothetical protein CMH32_03125, partial [Micavibrio sp.]|nr:hypothetical protein [Micavibrio sp.]